MVFFQGNSANLSHEGLSFTRGRFNMAPTKRRFCQHCQEYVSTRTYREHFNLYFNKETDQWQKIESSDEEGSPQAEGRDDVCDISDNISSPERTGDDEFNNETEPGINLC